MGVAESLAAWGIVRAHEVVEIAAGAGLELASAAAMLEKESSGGQNLWGRDGVDSGGFYVKGSPVTRAAYETWRPHRARLGSQGVGPCQLTYPPLQDQADRLGGCWDWRINVTVGFRHLAGLQKQFGIRDGFRRYNGSGPAAEAYADDAMKRRQKWIDRLGSRPAAPHTSSPGGDWFDMATEDDLRRIVAEQLVPIAKRGDVGFARDQILTNIGIDPTTAASNLSPEKRAELAVARRNDVGYALQQIGIRFDQILTARTDRPDAAAAAPLTADEVRVLLRDAIADVGPLVLTTATPEHKETPA